MFFLKSLQNMLNRWSKWNLHILSYARNIFGLLIKTRSLLWDHLRRQTTPIHCLCCSIAFFSTQLQNLPVDRTWSEHTYTHHCIRHALHGMCVTAMPQVGYIMSLHVSECYFRFRFKDFLQRQPPSRNLNLQLYKTGI